MTLGEKEGPRNRKKSTRPNFSESKIPWGGETEDLGLQGSVPKKLGDREKGGGEHRGVHRGGSFERNPRDLGKFLGRKKKGQRKSPLGKKKKQPLLISNEVRGV